MSNLKSGESLEPPPPPSALSTCGSTTPEAEKLASLDSALDLVAAGDPKSSDLGDETPEIDFAMPASGPGTDSSNEGNPTFRIEDLGSVSRESGSSSPVGMTDSQEWEKIEDTDVPKVNPDDVKEGEPEPEYDDILGSGQILKKVLTPGEANCRPTRGNRALVTVVGKLENGGVVEEYEKIEVSVGDIDINQGVDLLLPLMNKGETAEAIVKPRFCYSNLGLPPKIPADATLTYRIELIDFHEEDMETVSKAERSRIGNQKREKGNFWFGRQAYASAVQLYRRALDYLDENASDEGGDRDVLEGGGDAGDGDKDEPMMRQIWEDRLKVYNNLAAAQMKLEAYDAALRSVDNVLRCQPKNVKALFRKAKILTAKGETEEALVAMKEAAEVAPEDKAIAIELSKLSAKKKAEGQQDRNLYRKMFKEVTSSTSTSPSRSQPPRKSSLLSYSWKIALSGCIVAGLAFAIYRLKHV